MGYKSFTFSCTACSRLEDRLVKDSEIDDQRCPICSASMKKLLGYSGLYKIKGDNSASTPPKSKVKR